MLNIFILDTSLKITNLRSQLRLPGANELITVYLLQATDMDSGHFGIDSVWYRIRGQDPDREW